MTQFISLPRAALALSFMQVQPGYAAEDQKAPLFSVAQPQVKSDPFAKPLYRWAHRGPPGKGFDVRERLRVGWPTPRQRRW